MRRTALFVASVDEVLCKFVILRGAITKCQNRPLNSLLFCGNSFLWFCFLEVDIVCLSIYIQFVAVLVLSSTLLNEITLFTISIIFITTTVELARM